eukprot:TRINITY_DN423_c1_g1_i3.p1 TRINITY_DN423_c1_g1~~TRINITY_DN423_c1_g1_i3.p1  ORF type:complete len:253 (+),score=38.89 TRINITY_DN423_c1_g1_i3:117-875(+)
MKQMTVSSQPIQTVKRDKSGKRLVTKVYGPSIACKVMHYPDHMPLKALDDMVDNLTVQERFVDKSLVYFTGDVKEKKGKQLKKSFRKEERESRVLILSVKGKQFLTIQEAVDITVTSPLKDLVDDIELIGVNPKRNTRNTTSHIYVQLRTVELAESLVNTVDAMPYKGFYVHSPQCDEHPQFFPNRNYRESTHIWRNPSFDHPTIEKSTSFTSSSDPSTAPSTPVSLTTPRHQWDDMTATTYDDELIVEFYM